MQTIIVDHKHTHMDIKNRRLHLRTPEGRISHVPLGLIQRLIVTTSATVESSVLTQLAAQGVAILFISPRRGQTALFLPPFSGNHAARVAQYQAVCDAEKTRQIARRIVRMKIAAQWRALRRYAPGGAAYRAAIRKLPELMRQASQADIGSLRGMEGGAATMYFQALTHIFPTEAGFYGRKKRPAPDPANALLSLSYTLLHFEATHALHRAGLDPALGFLHEPAYNRNSLACDIMEPLRPMADQFVLRLFREQVLRAGHFSMRDGACMLGKAGRSIFYASWEHEARRARKALGMGAIILRRVLRP